MDVNFIFELISLIIMIIICFIITFEVQVIAKDKNFPLLFYLRLTSWSLFLYFLTNTISIILTDEIFALIAIFLMFPYIFFFIMFVNGIMKESYLSIGLIVACCLGISLIFSSFQTGALQVVIQLGYEKYISTGLFYITEKAFWFLFLGYFFYWGFKTWSNSPFYLRRKAYICFIGINVYVFGGLLFYLLSFINPLFSIFINLSSAVSLIIVFVTIRNNTKLLYVLPYVVYRIIVRDQKGNPLYDHDWSDLNISETIFTGFLNAIETMSEEVINVGGILDINLNKGILIINRSKYITVGLVASKSSKLLRDCVVNFSHDFESKFKRLLKKDIIDMKAYYSAYDLINKYFSNIPYRLLKNRKDLLTLSSEYIELPKELINKYKDIFVDEKEYHLIMNELSKFPISSFQEFIDFYNEFKDEIEKIEFKEKDKKKKEFFNNSQK